MSKYAKIGIYQIADEELCMILDKITGENIRFAGYEYNFGSSELAKSSRKSIGTIKEALNFLKKRPHEWRWIIVKLSCITSHEIEK